jgi:hypothetical protein
MDIQGIRVQALLKGMSMSWKRDSEGIILRNKSGCMRFKALRIRPSLTCTIYRPGFALSVGIWKEKPA